MTYIEELRNVIQRLHGVDSRHVQTVSVMETLKGETVWDGAVEVFELIGHPTAKIIYAWAHVVDHHTHPRFVTILHSHPIKSAEDAVRAFILQESRNLGTAQES